MVKECQLGPMESLNGRLKRLLSDKYRYSDFDRFRSKTLSSIKKESIKM